MPDITLICESCDHRSTKFRCMRCDAINDLAEAIPGCPADWDNPNWEKAEKCHDWKNYAQKELRLLWKEFAPIQKQAIAATLEVQADAEHWD